MDAFCLHYDVLCMQSVVSRGTAVCSGAVSADGAGAGGSLGLIFSCSWPSCVDPPSCG